MEATKPPRLTPKTPKINLEPKKTIIFTSSKDMLNTKRTEHDYYRRQLMEKKNQIHSLEKNVPKLDEFKQLLAHLIQDFQKSEEMTFFENETRKRNFEEKGEHFFDQSQDGVLIVRKGIKDYISYHERLAATFELEFSRNLFTLEQKLEERKKLLERETQLLENSQAETFTREGSIQRVVQEKDALKQAIIMLRSKLERHITSGNNQLGILQSKFERAQNELSKIHSLVQAEDQMSEDIQNQCRERKNMIEKQMASHQEIINNVEQLRAEFKKESHAHNTTRSALDKAKDELVQLTRAVESYRDNLKTQELLEAEIENKRLRSVINIEKHDFDEKLARHTTRTKELTEEINDLVKRIESINNQISSTEQKLQTQMMRIPDFDQIGKVLDRSLEQSRKQKEFILKRKYLLNEIRDKSRSEDQQDIQKSKERMTQLKALMPLPNEIAEQEQEAIIPRMHEDNDQWKLQMKDFIADLNFDPFENEE